MKDDLKHIYRYLGNFARKMEKGGSKLLLVEQLQPAGWLPTRFSRWLYIAIVSLFLFLFIGIVVGLPAGWAMGYESAHTSTGLARLQHFDFTCMIATTLCCGGIVTAGFAFTKTWGFGIACGLAFGASRAIIIGISESSVSSGLIAGMVTSAVGIPVLALVMKLRCHARDEIRPIESRKWDARKASFGVFAAISVGVVFGIVFDSARGLSFGLILIPIFALAFGYLVAGFEIKIYPNQGIQQSARIALRSALISALAGWIIVGSCYGLVLGLREGWDYGLEQGIVNGILGLTSAAAALEFGAMPFMQHLSLRLVLAAHGIVPLRLVVFLEAACELHLLRRVGGGYMFQHEYLREYFRDVRPR